MNGTAPGQWESTVLTHGPDAGRIGWRPADRDSRWQTNILFHPERLAPGPDNAADVGPPADTGPPGADPGGPPPTVIIVHRPSPLSERMPVDIPSGAEHVLTRLLAQAV